MPDILIVEKDTFKVYSLLLETIIDDERSSRGELFGLSFREGSSFNCWRGYQAVYELRNDSLLLNTVISYGMVSAWARGNARAVDSTLFKMVYKLQNGRFMGGVNATLSIPLNSNLVRWDGVFDRVYEAEKTFKIRRGILRRIKSVVNYLDSTNRINRRIGDTIQIHLFNVASSLDWKALDKFECADAYWVKIKNNGRVKVIGFRDYDQAELDDFWDDKSYKKCLRNLNRAWKNLKFDKVKWHGQPYEQRTLFVVFYDDDGLEDWNEYD